MMSAITANVGHALADLVDNSQKNKLCELLISFYVECEEKYRITFENEGVQLWIISINRQITRNPQDNKYKATISTQVNLIKKFKKFNLSLISLLFEEFIIEQMVVGDMSKHPRYDEDDEIRTFRIALQGKNMSTDLKHDNVSSVNSITEICTQNINVRCLLDIKDHSNIFKLRCIVKRKLYTIMKIKNIIEKN